jgi:hypothetical protein
MKWTYGTEGVRFPVKRGELWKLNGHYFLCADWLKQDLNVLKSLPAPSMCYVDPPWNLGNVRSFYTKAEQPDQPNDFERYLARLISVIDGLTSGHVYIEMGRQNTTLLKGLISAASLTFLEEFAITYYKTKPCVLIHYSRTKPQPLAPLPFEGLDDDDTPMLAIASSIEEGEYVIDLCAGRGLTSRSAASLGRKSINVELHPHRVSAALSRLSDQLGIDPHRMF